MEFLGRIERVFPEESLGVKVNFVDHESWHGSHERFDDDFP
jgi:hypothetical protein